MVASLLRTVSFVALFVGWSAVDAATVFSESFGTSNQTVGSGYSPVPVGTFAGPAPYRVVSNAATDFANGYTSTFDHTVASAAGAMLFFDGGRASVPIGSTSVPLIAGTQYTSSFFMSSGSTANPPILDLFIDGADAAASVTTALAGTWQGFEYDFTVLASTVVQFSIDDVNANIDSAGDDGALDDIASTFVPRGAVSEPSEAALMAGGLGIIGLAMGLGRRRRARRAELKETSLPTT